MDENTIHWLPLIVSSLIIFVGVLGSILPVLPGCVIVWAGIVVYKLWVPDGVSWHLVGYTAGLAALAQLLDFIAGYYGTKKFGGSTRGAIGAVLGGIIGPFVLTPFIGLVIGPVIGAILGEISANKSLRDSGKAGLGTLLGGIASFVIKICIAFSMTAWFYFEIF